MSQEPATKTALYEFLESGEALLIAMISMLIAQTLTFHLMLQHFRRNTNRQKRLHITHTLAIVPINGLFSAILGNYTNMYMNSSRIEYDLYEYIRQFYGAHAMYNFLMLCYEDLGGEEKVMTELSGRPVAALWIKRSPTWIYTDRFHRFCKYTVLYFWITKAVCIPSVGLLKWWYDYRENDWSDFGYILITVNTIISADLAWCGLGLFTRAVRNVIKPDPTLKFFAVAVPVLLTYYQGVALAILENVGVIASVTDASGQPLVGRVSTSCQHFLVLIELVVAAIGLRIAFPAPHDQPTPTANMKEVSDNSQDYGGNYFT